MDVLHGSDMGLGLVMISYFVCFLCFTHIHIYINGQASLFIELGVLRCGDPLLFLNMQQLSKCGG